MATSSVLMRRCPFSILDIVARLHPSMVAAVSRLKPVRSLRIARRRAPTIRWCTAAIDQQPGRGEELGEWLPQDQRRPDLAAEGKAIMAELTAAL